MTLVLFLGACSSGGIEVANEPDPASTAVPDTTTEEPTSTEAPTETPTAAPTPTATPQPTPLPEPTPIEVPDGQELARTDLINPADMEEVVATVVGCEPESIPETADPDTFGCRSSAVRVLAFDNSNHGGAGSMGAALQRRNIDDPDECHLAFTTKNWAIDVAIGDNANPDRLTQEFADALDPVFHSLCGVEGFGTAVDQLVNPDFLNSACATSFHYAEEAIIAWSRAVVSAPDEPSEPVHAFTCDLADPDDPTGTFESSVSFLQFPTETDANDWADWAVANDDFCWQTAVLREWVVRVGAPRFENDFLDPDVFDQVVADASVPASQLVNC